jgi:nucleoside-diphosphate-sugar epimerase
MEPLLKVRIAVLGATGYIGRSLTHAFMEKGANVVPFSRNIEKGQALLASYGIEAPLHDYATFQNRTFDVVINATGIGSPTKLKENPYQIFAVTEAVDEMLVGYLKEHGKTLVFNMSSGAVYGKAANEMIKDGTLASFDPSILTAGDCYGIAKFASEAKHRALKEEYAITDLRVFAFFSRFVDTSESFLLSQVVAAIEKGEVLKTSPDDIVRDFTTAEGILDVISFLLTKSVGNAAHDIASKEPVTKFILLDTFKEKFGLQYEIASDVPISPTGNKSVYASSATSLKEMGYTPKETSLEAIEREMHARKR